MYSSPKGRSPIGKPKRRSAGGQPFDEEAGENLDESLNGIYRDKIGVVSPENAVETVSYKVTLLGVFPVFPVRVFMVSLHCNDFFFIFLRAKLNLLSGVSKKFRRGASSHIYCRFTLGASVLFLNNCVDYRKLYLPPKSYHIKVLVLN